MTFQAFSMAEALAALNSDGPDTAADQIGVDARWQVTAADALELAAWFVDTIGVEHVEEQLLQDWLPGKLSVLLGVGRDAAETLAGDAAVALARHLGINDLHDDETEDDETEDYDDDGDGDDDDDELPASGEPVDLIYEVTERAEGDPGQLLRKVAQQLRNR